jgi:hypothetical protein
MNEARSDARNAAASATSSGWPPRPSEKGKRTYIMTTRRTTSGDELNRSNGLGGSAQNLRFIAMRYQPGTIQATLA